MYSKEAIVMFLFSKIIYLHLFNSAHIEYCSEYSDPILSGLSSKNSIELVGYYTIIRPIYNNYINTPDVAFCSPLVMHYFSASLIQRWFWIRTTDNNNIHCVCIRYNVQYLKCSVSLTSQTYTNLCTYTTTHTATGLYRDRLICLSWYVRDVSNNKIGEDLRIDGGSETVWFIAQSRHKLQPQVFILWDIGAINCGGEVN